jgi:hypothetical protein
MHDMRSPILYVGPCSVGGEIGLTGKDDAMPTLVLPPRDTDDAQAIQTAAQAVGWYVERLPTWRVPPGLRDQDLVLYGEPLFIDVVTPTLEVAVLETPWDWLALLPEEFRRRAITFTTLGEAARHASAVFVKPTEDKCFPAQVYSSGAALAAATVALPATTPVLVAEPVAWEIEFRCFVLERQVMACAPYLREGDPLRDEHGTWPATAPESAEAVAYATAVLAASSVPLPAAIVLDVGKLRGQGWAVVEANGAWGAGLYGCDPAHVLPVLARATRALRTLAPDDVPWVRKQYVVE